MTAQPPNFFSSLADGLELDLDFERFAAECLKIRTKTGSIESFLLNQAQRHIHEKCEQQLRETGMVRALVVKGRQQGVSTYVQGRFFHRVTRRRGFKAFVLANSDDTTAAIFGIAKRFYDSCPETERPVRTASNAKEIVFAQLDAGYRVATAGSEAVGRGDTLQGFHGSEVAYWKAAHAQDHLSGALQAVPALPGTEVILESTAAAPKGMFYDMCQKALAGQGDFILIFVPWFWQTEYRRAVPDGFELTDEEHDYAERYGLDLEQMAWRRAKIEELFGVHRFRREYPATIEEAFTADIRGALWQRSLIDRARAAVLPPLKRIVVAVDPSGGAGERNDEVGIVAAGLGHDGTGYVLEDGSGRMGPNAWGERAVALYQRWNADRIVAEGNFGGAMVESTIRAVSQNVPVKIVTASRGKAVRAEPISALYERGKVLHVGRFVALEDELCTWKPGDKRSPNRLDALVWALTELMLDTQADGAGWLQFAAEHLAAEGFSDAVTALNKGS